MDMDFLQSDFQAAVEYVTAGNPNAGGIGTLSEKQLHAALKQFFEPRLENQEITVGSYVADIVGEYGIIEIQTAGFDRLRPKLTDFLQAAPVTVVYPVAATTRLVWLDPQSGEVLSSRKSPQKGSALNIFDELYKISEFVLHERFTLCVVMVDVIEYRYEGRRGNRRRGSRRVERTPERIDNILRFRRREDYLSLLPDSLPERFTVKQLAEHPGFGKKAGMVAYAMNKIGLLRRVESNSRAYVYERVE